MTTTSTQLTSTETAALKAFAAAHGRGWKAELADVYWYNARIWEGGSNAGAWAEYGHALHGLRNRLGPAWLKGFRLSA